MEKRPKPFLPLQGDYENLVVYKIAKCIYSITRSFEMSRSRRLYRDGKA